MPLPSKAFDLNWTDIQKAGRDLLIAALAAALTVAADQAIVALTDWKDRSLIDASIFMLLTGLLSLLRRFVTDYRKVIIVGLLACVLVLPAGSAMAEDVTVRVTGIARGQSYELVYNADGTVAVKLIQTIAVGGGPAPVPNPTPTPNPTSVAAQVQSLTAAALVGGGSHSAAANLAAVYSVVASQLESGGLTLAQVAPALKSLTDSLISGPGEAPKWVKWRTGVGDLLTPRLGDKAAAVATLRSVEQGIKNAVDANSAIIGAEAINWQKLIEILLPLILKLLEQLFKM